MEQPKDLKHLVAIARDRYQVSADISCPVQAMAWSSPRTLSTSLQVLETRFKHRHQVSGLHMLDPIQDQAAAPVHSHESVHSVACMPLSTSICIGEMRAHGTHAHGKA
eukprot:1161833-Pelagomonas_calceolata.AAC.29